MQTEVHVAGVLVLAAPGCAVQVADMLGRLPGTEVRAIGETGKVVTVCEATSSEATLALIARMRALPGVLDVALVYQHAESAAAMEEEIDDETDAPGIH